MRLRAAVLAGACALSVVLGAQPAPQPAVVLITLDGARHQEVFSGLELDALRSQLREGDALEAHPLYQRYWAATPEERRLKLLPFFWGTLMTAHGSVAGNPARGSRVHLTNGHWFSYPGYAEMLLGRAHDTVIKSNDPVQNPFPTVLEFLRGQAKLTASQAVLFASWNVFNQIGEKTPNALTINAGFEAWESGDPEVRKLSALQFETPTPWDSVRHDAYTFRFAMDHLARHRPRVIYLALGETDDWAHDGRYDQVLEAYVRTDRYLQQLWTWLQSQSDYRGRTSILITTDHGRGSGLKEWRDHGAKVSGAGETWMAFVSPSMAQRGEWSAHPPLTTAQVAATLVTWMGFDWKAFDPAAAPPVTAR
jgi:hypothetical protein